MFGYSITINGKAVSSQFNICYKDIVCSNYMIKKFEQDKLFNETDEYIVLLDGVILNKRQLIEDGGFNHDDLQWLHTIERLYKEKGEHFFCELRGSFAGALYDKTLDKWIIFGDQLGTKYTYYSKVGDFFVCAEMCDMVYESLKLNDIKYELDVQSAKLLLSYGYMIEDRTLCNVIKKIQPGCYIVVENGQIEEKRYYLLNNDAEEGLSEQETIDKVNLLFRQAVRRQFEKDNEYGYKHIVALSGGLDSRMTSFVAQDCGYTNQLNSTFSQTDYWDEIVPKQMAAYMKHEWLFKALDNGIWLKDVDEVTTMTGGNVAFQTVAHGNSLLKYVNFSSLGLCHTGQIGDSVISTNIKPDDEFEFGFGAYNMNGVDDTGFKPSMQFKNKELGFWYYRALSGANAGIQYIYNYSESLSPFLDLDFLEFSLKIPWKYRRAHELYKKWIIQKYPEAAQFVWEKIGYKITDKTIKVRGRKIPVKKILKKVSSIFDLKKKIGIESIKHMNPYGYYLNVNKELKTLLLEYFNYIDNVADDSLRSTLLQIKNTEDSQEFLLAVSLLAAIKKYYK